FSKLPAGNYVVELRDALGRSVSQKRITINNETQVQVLPLDQGSAKGIYMMSVFDNGNQSIYTQKVVVQ
ncbi:MAG TPA: T9SS type A sorting domain-containing protein, partial [Flavisolibacter sp.]|nr:T9SS type A sorting domain-containing protein [Flavisolibacter sp.]